MDDVSTLDLWVRVIMFDLGLAMLLCIVGVTRTIRKNRRLRVQHHYNVHKSDFVTRPVDIHLKDK